MEKEKLSKFEDPKYRDLVRRTVAKGASDDELDEFLYYCKERGLDPVLKQAYLIIRKVRNYDTGQYENKATIQTSIEGLRMIAERTGLHAGTEREIVFDASGKPKGATARVYRKDWKVPASETVSFWEYAQRGRDGSVMGLWATKPETMIKKVAEAAALRLAFPAELGGMYEFAEMDAVEDETVDTADEPENEKSQNKSKNSRSKNNKQKSEEPKTGNSDVLGDLPDLGDDLPPLNEPKSGYKPTTVIPSDEPRWISGKWVGEMKVVTFPNGDDGLMVCMAMKMDNGATVLFPEKHPIIEKEYITAAMNKDLVVEVLSYTWNEYEAIAGNTGNEMRRAAEAS